MAVGQTGLSSGPRPPSAARVSRCHLPQRRRGAHQIHARLLPNRAPTGQGVGEIAAVCQPQPDGRTERRPQMGSRGGTKKGAVGKGRGMAALLVGKRRFGPSTSPDSQPPCVSILWGRRKVAGATPSAAAAPPACGCPKCPKPRNPSPIHPPPDIFWLVHRSSGCLILGTDMPWQPHPPLHSFTSLTPSNSSHSVRTWSFSIRMMSLPEALLCTCPSPSTGPKLHA